MTHPGILLSILGGFLASRSLLGVILPLVCFFHGFVSCLGDFALGACDQLMPYVVLAFGVGEAFWDFFDG